MAVANVSRVKAALGIPAGITFHDLAITAAVSWSDSYVLGKLGLPELAVQTATEYPEVYGSTQRTILLERWPVASVVAVTNGGDAVASGSRRLDSSIGKITLAGENYWSDAADGVVVTYTWGWSSATLPDEIAGAADELAATYWNALPLAGLSEQSDGERRIKTPDPDASCPIPPRVATVLARYQRMGG